MKYLLLFLFLCLFFLSVAQVNHCIADRYSQVALFDSTDIQVESGVFFAAAERWPSTLIDSLHMDVYRPSSDVDTESLRPLILQIHGGSFLSGSRAAMSYYAIEMARRGFVTATMSYRLGWDCAATEALLICPFCGTQAGKMKVATYRAVQDARSALCFLMAHAAEYGIDPEAVFIQGESAGAITALNTTFWDQEEADSFCPTCSDLLGGIGDCGNEFTADFEIKGVIDNCGAVTSAAVMQGTDIPIIGFHDIGDCVVPYNSGQVLNCLGCTAFYYVLGSDGIRVDHAQNGTCFQMNTVEFSIAHCSYPAPAIIGKSSCFIKSILCGSCNTSSSSEIYNIPDCSTDELIDGLPDFDRLAFNVYPIPAQDQIHITSDSEYTGSIKASILHIDGRVEMSYLLEGGAWDIDLHGIGPGFKFLILRIDDGRAVIRKIQVIH